MKAEDLDIEDAGQTGLAAAYGELLRDPAFNRLVGMLATVYGVQ